jgi:hypothetical protein
LLPVFALFPRTDAPDSDYDGDGKADVLRANGSDGYISRGGVGSWERLNGSSLTLADVMFGDFDGDGKRDVFRSRNTK